MKISVVIPSKGRPAQLAACVRRLFETTRGHTVEAVVVCDEQEAYDLTIDALERAFVSPDHLVWSWATLPVIPAFNEGLRMSTGDALVLGADDLWWGDGWLDAALEALNTLDDADGLVGLNDLAPIKRDYATHYLMTRRYLARENGGVLACPHYQHTYIDPEACARALRAERYVFAEDARVDHRHWLWGKAEKDPTYTETDPTIEHDRQMYAQRAALGFPDDYPPVIRRPQVWWAVLHERMLYEGAVRAIEDVADHCARLGYHRLQAGYAATDVARDSLRRKFLDVSTSPDDTLVMLDNDHLHPANIVERLSSITNVGVVGALCRRRGDEMDELIQARNPETGRLDRVVGYEPGDIVPCAMAGGGAMAIKRWAFERIERTHGMRYFQFRYAYDDDCPERPGEEIYFYRLAEAAGVSIACDTGTPSPHITLITVEGLLTLLTEAEQGRDWRKLIRTTR